MPPMVMFVLLAAAMTLGSLSLARAQAPTEIAIGYLHRPPARSALSLVEVPAANDGVAGAELALEDNNTTGKFLEQHYALAPLALRDGDDPAAVMAALSERGVSLVIADLPAAALLKAADAGAARGMLVFNTGATEDRLREEDCRRAVVRSEEHTSELQSRFGIS